MTGINNPFQSNPACSESEVIHSLRYTATKKRHGIERAPSGKPLSEGFEGSINVTNDPEAILFLNTSIHDIAVI